MACENGRLNMSIEAFDMFFSDMLSFIHCQRTEFLIDALDYLLNNTIQDEECPESITKYVESYIINVSLAQCSIELVVAMNVFQH